MVTINDIEDAIAERIEATFPGEILYRGYAPYDHKSPSNLTGRRSPTWAVT